MNVQKQYYDAEKDAVPIASFAQIGAAAHVYASNLSVDTIHGTMILRGRPLVLFNADRPIDRSPVFALHELTHALQLQRRPLIEPDEQLDQIHTEDELEAYHVSAQVIRGYQQAGRHSDQQLLIDDTMKNRMLKIDEIRQQYQSNDTNPFEANEKIAASLAAHDLAVVNHH